MTNEASQKPTKDATVEFPSKELNVVKHDEAIEFLKIIKKNDYKVVDQLHQTPSKISIMFLLLSSRAQKDGLLKVFAQAHITQSITVNQFDRMIANITAWNTLSFNNDELLKEV